MHPRKLTLDTSPSLLTGTAGFDARSVVFCISLLRKSCSWDCEEEQLDRYQDMHQDLCTAEKSFLENCAFMSCLWSCNTWEPWASHTCIRSNKRPGRRAGRAWRMRGERETRLGWRDSPLSRFWLVSQGAPSPVSANGSRAASSQEKERSLDQETFKYSVTLAEIQYKIWK